MAATRHVKDKEQQPRLELGDERSIVRQSDPRPVRIGLQLQPQHADFKVIRRTLVAAEEIGIDIVFNRDHFYPLTGDPSGKHFECWTTLAAWAETTERVEIGALVTCNSYRNPELLADMARTVDHISDGRLILGIGSGWFEKDYHEYGYEFGTAGSRLDDLGMSLQRIKRRWSRLNPPPIRDIPVLIGGGDERKTLKLAAEHASIWHFFGDRDTMAHKHRILDSHCAALSRDPSEIERASGVDGGEPDKLGAALYDIGTRLFTLSISGPRYDLGVVRDWLAWRDDQNQTHPDAAHLSPA